VTARLPRALPLLLWVLAPACSPSLPVPPAPGPPPGADLPDAGSAPDGGSPLRSALYPEDWTPGFTGDGGRFLHDFSWAGYRAGAREPPEALPAPVLDAVAGFGADPDGGTDATAALQAALDAAAVDGGTVYLPPGRYRVDGQLALRGSRVVLAGAGPSASLLAFTATATSHPGLAYGAHLSVGTEPSLGAAVPLSADAPARAHSVEVEEAGALSPGDEVAVGWTLTDAFVAEHGMAGRWDTPAFAFYQAWQPFAWRTVESVDTSARPHRVRLDVPLRYPAKVRDGASLRKVSGRTTEVGIQSLGLSNVVDEGAAWSGDQVHAVQFVGVQDAWMRDVESFPARADTQAHLQSSGVLVRASRRVTLERIRLGEVQNRGSGGNGYLFELRQANEVLTRDCTASGGRHNFIQNWEFGTSGCVWLDVVSELGRARDSRTSPLSQPGLSETHRALAHANLFDRSTFRDGLSLVNRGGWSSQAGHTATQNVVWNCTGDGTGVLRAYQFGHGYVVAPRGFASMSTALEDLGAALFGWGAGTAPEDDVELAGEQAVEPPSLYLDQRQRRLGR
jgi:hypothetical protein